MLVQLISQTSATCFETSNQSISHDNPFNVSPAILFELKFISACVAIGLCVGVSTSNCKTTTKSYPAWGESFFWLTIFNDVTGSLLLAERKGLETPHFAVI